MKNSTMKMKMMKHNEPKRKKKIIIIIKRLNDDFDKIIDK